MFRLVPVYQKMSIHFAASSRRSFAYFVRTKEKSETAMDTLDSGQRNGLQMPQIPIHGIIFDMDGTLTLPVLDFKKLRRLLNCPPAPKDLLEFINEQPKDEQKKLMKVVEQFEEEGNREMKLQPGIHTMLSMLSCCGIERAIITRNGPPAIEYFLKFLGDPTSYGGPFSHILTREFEPTKPDPHPVLHICKQWGVKPCNTVMVGDHLHDIQCGTQAGAVTILLNNSKNGAYKEIADFNVDSLEEIGTLLSATFEVQRDKEFLTNVFEDL